MSQQGAKETLIEVATGSLKNDIVNGVLVPDQKLSMAELKANYGMGASPLREALARLSQLGFVVFDRRRGFRVATMSQCDLTDITRVRKIIEAEALALAIAKGDDEWDIGIVGATRRLQRLATRARAGDTPEPNEIEQAHWQFHRSLLSGCGSPRLLELQENLYNQAQRYRSLMMSQWQELDQVAEIHQQLADLVLSRDIQKACAALSEHIELTPLTVYSDNSQ